MTIHIVKDDGTLVDLTPMVDGFKMSPLPPQPATSRRLVISNSRDITWRWQTSHAATYWLVFGLEHPSRSRMHAEYDRRRRARRRRNR